MFWRLITHFLIEWYKDLSTVDNFSMVSKIPVTLNCCLHICHGILTRLKQYWSTAPLMWNLNVQTYAGNNWFLRTGLLIIKTFYQTFEFSPPCPPPRTYWALSWGTTPPIPPHTIKKPHITTTKTQMAFGLVLYLTLPCLVIYIIKWNIYVTCCLICHCERNFSINVRVYMFLYYAKDLFTV